MARIEFSTPIEGQVRIQSYSPLQGGNVPLGTNTAVLAAVTLANGATTTVSTGFTDPTVPRNLVVKGNASGITGNVVITGTNVRDEVITETIVAVDATAVVGNKAFKTVTSVVFPARTTSGDTISIGTGAKLGFPHKMRLNTVLLAFLNSVKEGTLPTVATSTSAVESNTFTLNSALAGQPVELYYIYE